MKIRTQQLKEFLHFSFLDAVFFLAFGMLIFLKGTADYNLIRIICGWYMIAYILVFLYQQFKFFLKIMFATHGHKFLALLFSLNFLFIVASILFYGSMISSFNFQRLFSLSNPIVLMFYASGIVALISLIFRDRYKDEIKNKKG